MMIWRLSQLQKQLLKIRNLMHRLGSQARGAILRMRAGYFRTGVTDV